MAGETQDYLKKKSLTASEQTREDVAAQRACWYENLSDIPAQKLVFLDESGVTTNMTRLLGRCPSDQRLKASVPHGHWQTSTIISAIRLSGAAATAVFDCPTDQEVFLHYIKQVLLPNLSAGDVVIMDNLSRPIQKLLSRENAGVYWAKTG